ncbi:MAG: hypothetical protein ACP5VR_01745 [Acidimicrobiales bacterium]
MGAPNVTSGASRRIGLAGSREGEGLGPTATADDVLAAFGPLVASVAQRERDSAQAGAEKLAARAKFLADFAMACETEVKPAMDAVARRLRQLGGDALVEEHPGGEARFAQPRIALWMSFEGEVGLPRLDRHPYLLLEADVEERKVQVDEGDMWRGAGGSSSGRAGKWEVSELTQDRVTRELLAIAQRAAR